MMVCRVSCDSVLRKSVLYLIPCNGRSSGLPDAQADAGGLQYRSFLVPAYQHKGSACNRFPDSPKIGKIFECVFPRRTAYTASDASKTSMSAATEVSQQHRPQTRGRCTHRESHGRPQKHHPPRNSTRNGFLLSRRFSAAEAMNGEWKTCTMARPLRIRLSTA